MENQYIQVFVSCESPEQAKSMVDSLLDDQIIACAQILPQIESFYRWQGQIAQTTECLLILKTHGKHFEAIEISVKRLHNYEVPEIIAIPLVNGSTEYLNWINEQLKS